MSTIFSTSNKREEFHRFGHTSTNVSHSNLYSKPQLIDTVVYSDRIELIYKKYYMVSLGHRIPDPIVYAEVYSRIDGSMVVKEGKYIPPQTESYEF